MGGELEATSSGSKKAGKDKQRVTERKLPACVEVSDGSVHAVGGARHACGDEPARPGNQQRQRQGGGEAQEGQAGEEGQG